MGMFDTVIYRCAWCGEDNSEQTKAGECLLSTYRLEDAPDELKCSVANDIFYCSSCAEKNIIKTQTMATVYRWQ